ncbi:MAG: hypothetical protein GC179_12445 [Anaerolineaceae bacterium]|nr:hypothetical protein [Anaerolineaceae bacterium]
MPLIIEQFLLEVRQRFLLRWVLANVIGWTVGLYFGVLNPICFAGAGVVAGLVLGASQWWALRSTALGNKHSEDEGYVPLVSTHISQPARQWIISTFAGAALGLIPALALATGLVLLSNSLAALLGGAILGLAVGIGQWMILKYVSNRGLLWLAVNALGGAACGWLTLTPIIRGLPIGMLLGAGLFGYVTGRVLERIIEEKEHSG